MSDTPARAALLSLAVTRPEAHTAVLDVVAPHHRELFFIAAGPTTIAVTIIETSDTDYGEPRVYVVRKPHDWSMDVADEQLLLQLWETLTPR